MRIICAITNTRKCLFSSRCSYNGVGPHFPTNESISLCSSAPWWRKSKWAYFTLLRLRFSLLTSCVELHFTNLFVATNDNRRKLGCTAATVLFHYVMHFHWHPGWCVVVFSSNCNKCPWVFSCAAQGRKSRSGKWLLCAQDSGEELFEVTHYKNRLMVMVFLVLIIVQRTVIIIWRQKWIFLFKSKDPQLGVLERTFKRESLSAALHWPFRKQKSELGLLLEQFFLFFV